MRVFVVRFHLRVPLRFYIRVQDLGVWARVYVVWVAAWVCVVSSWRLCCSGLGIDWIRFGGRSVIKS